MQQLNQDPQHRYQPVPPLPSEPQPQPGSPGQMQLQSQPSMPPELHTDELNAEEKLAAVLEGTRRFSSYVKLAEHLGRTRKWLFDLRKRQAYKDLVQATVVEVARRMTESAANIEEMFNSQIRPSVETLIEVRDNPFEKAGDRIKASLGLIDHAPAAPRAKSEVSGGIVLQIPVQQIEGIREALIDEGEGELVEMLEGKDFKQIEYEPPEAPGEDYRVPVREIE